MHADWSFSPNNLSSHDGIFLSERASFSATGSQYFQVPNQDGQRDIWFDTPNDDPTVGALFPLHEACISISCSAIDHLRPRFIGGERKPALDVLNGLIETRFTSRRSCTDLPDSTHNDLFDLCAYSSLYGPRSVVAMTRLEWWGGEYDVGSLCILC